MDSFVTAKNSTKTVPPDTDKPESLSSSPSASPTSSSSSPTLSPPSSPSLSSALAATSSSSSSSPLSSLSSSSLPAEKSLSEVVASSTIVASSVRDLSSTPTEYGGPEAPQAAQQSPIRHEMIPKTSPNDPQNDPKKAPLKQKTNSPYDSSHVTMVYNALCILLTLGDDLSRVDRANVLRGISALQCSDEPGLFRASLLSPERDMRFVYSAVASCYILDGLDVLDQDAIISFIDRSYTYEGGFSQLPGLEAHAGATYCAVASLTLLDALPTVLPSKSRRRDRLIKWLVSLQRQGFHGRMHKPDDTCYTFWVCGSLRLLGGESLVNRSELLQFASSAWDDVLGGIRKYPDPTYPADPLHTYLCLSGLACLKTPHLSDPENSSITTAVPAGDGRTPRGASTSENGQASTQLECFQALFTQVLCPIRPELNVGESTYTRLKMLHKKWRTLLNDSVANKLTS